MLGFIDKKLRHADSKDEFENNLTIFKEKWEKKYPEYVSYVFDTYLKEYYSYYINCTSIIF